MAVTPAGARGRATVSGSPADSSKSPARGDSGASNHKSAQAPRRSGGLLGGDQEFMATAEKAALSVSEIVSKAKDGTFVDDTDANAWEHEQRMRGEKCWRPGTIIHPHSPFKIRWDFLLMALILYSVCVIPFRIGFDVEATGAAFALDIVIDVLFGIDMFINFHAGYMDEYGKFVLSRQRVAVTYLRTWFVIDFCSTVPLDRLIEIILGGDGSAFRSLRLIRTLRLIRLLKLARLFKLSRIMQYLESVAALNPSILRLVSLLFQVVFTAHFLSCFWHLLPSVEGDGTQLSWFTTADITLESPLSTRYTASMYWAVATMMSVGFGDVYSITTWERVYSVLTQVIGVSLFGFLVANMSSLLDNVDARATAFRAKMGEVQEYMHDRNLPIDLQRRILAYYKYYFAHNSMFDEQAILDELSNSLRNDLVFHANLNLIKTIKLLHGEDVNAIAATVTRMKPRQAVEGEDVVVVGETPKEIFFLVKGVVEAITMPPSALTPTGALGNSTNIHSSSFPITTTSGGVAQADRGGDDDGGGARDDARDGDRLGSDDGSSSKTRAGPSFTATRLAGGKPQPDVIGVFVEGEAFGHQVAVRNEAHFCGFRALTAVDMQTLTREDYEWLLYLFPDLGAKINNEADTLHALLQTVKSTFEAARERAEGNETALRAVQAAVPIAYGLTLCARRDVPGYLHVKAETQKGSHFARQNGDSSDSDDGNGGSKKRWTRFFLGDDTMYSVRRVKPVASHVARRLHARVALHSVGAAFMSASPATPAGVAAASLRSAAPQRAERHSASTAGSSRNGASAVDRGADTGSSGGEPSPGPAFTSRSTEAAIPPTGSGRTLVVGSRAGGAAVQPAPRTRTRDDHTITDDDRDRIEVGPPRRGSQTAPVTVLETNGDPETARIIEGSIIDAIRSASSEGGETKAAPGHGSGGSGEAAKVAAASSDLESLRGDPTLSFGFGSTADLRATERQQPQPPTTGDGLTSIESVTKAVRTRRRSDAMIEAGAAKAAAAAAAREQRKSHQEDVRHATHTIRGSQRGSFREAGGDASDGASDAGDGDSDAGGEDEPLGAWDDRMKRDPGGDGAELIIAGVFIDTDETARQTLKRGIILAVFPPRMTWDVFMLLVTLYSVLVTPFQIAFTPGTIDDVQLGIETFIDVVFFCDILLNFRTSYATLSGQIHVTVPSLVASHYFKTWFAADLLSTFPFERVVAAVVTEGSTSSLLPLARLLRLMKLVRVMKLGKHLTNVQLSLFVSPTVVRLGKLLFQVSFLAHLMGCFWFAVSNADPEAETTWWAETKGLNSGSSTTVDYYVAGIYWAFTVMTTVGYGDIGPQHDLERVYAIVCIVLGATVFGFMVGHVTSLVSRLDSKSQRSRDKMQQVRDYLRELRVPASLWNRVHRYYEYLFTVKSVYDEDSILAELSPTLRNELLLCMNRDIIENIPFFQSQDPVFTAHVVSLLRPQFCAPGEVVFREGEVGADMYFLIRGQCLVVGTDMKTGKEVTFKTLYEGSYFGELSLLLNTRRTATIRAKSHLNLFALSKDDIGRMLQQYPTLAPHMRRAMARSLESMGDNRVKEEDVHDRVVADTYSRKWREKSLKTRQSTMMRTGMTMATFLQASKLAMKARADAAVRAAQEETLLSSSGNGLHVVVGEGSEAQRDTRDPTSGMGATSDETVTAAGGGDAGGDHLSPARSVLSGPDVTGNRAGPTRESAVPSSLTISRGDSAAHRAAHHHTATHDILSSLTKFPPQSLPEAAPLDPVSHLTKHPGGAAPGTPRGKGPRTLPLPDVLTMIGGDEAGIGLGNGGLDSGRMGAGGASSDAGSDSAEMIDLDEALRQVTSGSGALGRS